MRMDALARAVALACLLAIGACAELAPAPAPAKSATATAFAAPSGPRRSALPVCTALPLPCSWQVFWRNSYFFDSLAVGAYLESTVLL